VHLLRKIPLVSISPQIGFLRRVRDHAIWKKLLHLPRINVGVIRLASDPALFACVSYSALEMIARDRREDRRAKIAWGVREMLRLAEAVGERRRIIRSREDLEIFHRYAMLRLDLWDYEGFPGFPPPPYASSPSVQAVTTWDELKAEAMEMKHCVLSYGPAIAEGRNYIYRIVTNEERATLALRNCGGRWEIEQIAGVANAPISASTRAIVRSWLYSASARSDYGDYGAMVERWVRDEWIADPDRRWRDLEELERAGGG
jgi:hypothetical protein